MKDFKAITKCATDHCHIMQPDATNFIFVLLECEGCPERNYCIKVKRTIEVEVNKRRSIK